MDKEFTIKELAERFALEHVFSGEIPLDKSFEEVLEIYGNESCIDFGLDEVSENVFSTESAIEYVRNFAKSVERLLESARGAV